MGEETGHVRRHRYVSIADVGTAINPLQCESQEEGGVVMGIGHTFFEHVVYEDGQLLNPGLIDYRILVMADVPDELRSILVENGDGPGLYDAVTVLLTRRLQDCLGNMSIGQHHGGGHTRTEGPSLCLGQNMATFEVIKLVARVG